jgi:hypothetical protein
VEKLRNDVKTAILGLDPTAIIDHRMHTFRLQIAWI